MSVHLFLDKACAKKFKKLQVVLLIEFFDYIIEYYSKYMELYGHIPAYHHIFSEFFHQKRNITFTTVYRGT